MIDRELTNLTRAQVEALLECFDFLLCGYGESECSEFGDLWYISLVHQRTKKRIQVFIHPDRYRIVVAGHTRKQITFSECSDRYRIIVNSERSLGVVRLRAHADKMLVPG